MGTNEKQSKPARKSKPGGRGLRRLAAEVPALTRAALGTKGFAEAGLLAHWREIVGEELARMAQPAKLSFRRGERFGGTLTVKCGGAAALEIQHLAPIVLERVNAYLGYGALGRLKIEQGAIAGRSKPLFLPPVSGSEKGAIEGRLSGIGEAKLRESLLRLGIAMRRRAKAGK